MSQPPPPLDMLTYWRFSYRADRFKGLYFKSVAVEWHLLACDLPYTCSKSIARVHVQSSSPEQPRLSGTHEITAEEMNFFKNSAVSWLVMTQHNVFSLCGEKNKLCAPWFGRTVNTFILASLWHFVAFCDKSWEEGAFAWTGVQILRWRNRAVSDS